ncbi:hypothetical protein F5Y17DRAFT_423881 [Xylariaceae sp. FL0594]|nr:hypothetical protein F5Y17DRAFT_423881 [Xylariaceae sp. FL0594]
MMKRSVLSTLCASSNAAAHTVAFQGATRRIGVVSQLQRSFTSTSRRDANITHFTPTSSPELDAELEEIRRKIILPSFLHPEQQKKIHSRKYADQLRSDPITMEIDGQIFKFGYVHPRDYFATRGNLVKALAKFNGREDWANLLPLLEGLHHADRELPHTISAKIIRLAGMQGFINVILECARSVRRTGFKLDTAEKVNETLHRIQLKAVDSAWDLEETQQALRWARMVVDMLQDEGHKPKRPLGQKIIPGEIAMSRHPMVLIAPMHLAAALVNRHDAGQDFVDMVHKYAREIVALWPEGVQLTDLHPVSAVTHKEERFEIEVPSKFVAHYAPLLHGLDEAIKVVGPELASQLRSRRETLATQVEENRKRGSADASSRGEVVYSKFYGA